MARGTMTDGDEIDDDVCPRGGPRSTILSYKALWHAHTPRSWAGFSALVVLRAHL
jgi:hypothetical protein